MYQVYDSERAEVLVGGGVHAIDFDVSMSGAAFIGDQERQVPVNFWRRSLISGYRDFMLSIKIGELP